MKTKLYSVVKAEFEGSIIEFCYDPNDPSDAVVNCFEGNERLNRAQIPVKDMKEALDAFIVACPNFMLESTKENEESDD